MSTQETKFKAIADAIRAKDGTAEPICASDFAQRIRAIPASSLPDDVRTVTLIADPPEGGTVSGGGYASDGMTCHAKATANKEERYVFKGWKENGETVCETLDYTFPVADSRELTAAFLQQTYVSGVDWWENYGMPLSASWWRVAYGNGKFVAVNLHTTYDNGSAYSSDGINWTKSDSYNNYCIAFGDGRFVAIDGSNYGSRYSLDGINWSAGGTVGFNSGRGIAYGGGTFVVVGRTSTKISYSTDGGLNFKTANLPNSMSLVDIAYGKGKFVAIIENGNTFLYSYNGIGWTSATVSSANETWSSIEYGNGKFIAVSKSKTYVYSEDGIHWTKGSLPSSNWSGIVWGDNKFVACTTDGNIAYSEDGITWEMIALPSSPNLKDVAYGNGKFIAIAYNSRKVYYSSAKGPGL